MRREFWALPYFFLITFFTMPILRAQEELAPQTSAGAPLPAGIPRSQAKELRHCFWDATNIALFAGVGAARALDYSSTRHFRDRGVDEWLLTNDIVDNKPLFVGIEVAGAAASIGVSYLLHRHGHHRLERWVSIIHIGVGVGGAVRNYTLTAHPLMQTVALGSVQ